MDLTQSLTALFDTQLTWQDFILAGVRLGDDAQAIPRDNIKDTTMQPFPAGVACMSYRNGKSYYEVVGMRKEYLLADRITTVYQHNGWVHLTGGARFRIFAGKVVEFRLDEQLLAPLRAIPFSQIEQRFGRADKKVVWVEPVDALYTTTFIYAARQMRITYEDDKQTINGVNIGASLNAEHQLAMTAGPVSTTDSNNVNGHNWLPAWWRTLFANR
ncbi:MAG TPA: hypothetical protein VF690_11060 [Hymenobacter sp.]